jgi:hypothetical protein
MSEIVRTHAADTLRDMADNPTVQRSLVAEGGLDALVGLAKGFVSPMAPVLVEAFHEPAPPAASVVERPTAQYEQPRVGFLFTQWDYKYREGVKVNPVGHTPHGTHRALALEEGGDHDHHGVDYDDHHGVDHAAVPHRHLHSRNHAIGALDVPDDVESLTLGSLASEPVAEHIDLGHLRLATVGEPPPHSRSALQWRTHFVSVSARGRFFPFVAREPCPWLQVAMQALRNLSQRESLRPSLRDHIGVMDTLFRFSVRSKTDTP